MNPLNTQISWIVKISQPKYIRLALLLINLLLYLLGAIAPITGGDLGE